MDGKELLRQGSGKALARQRPAAVAGVAAAAGIGGVVLGYRLIARYGFGQRAAASARKIFGAWPEMPQKPEKPQKPERPQKPKKPENPDEEDAFLSGNVRVLPAREMAERPAAARA